MKREYISIYKKSREGRDEMITEIILTASVIHRDSRAFENSNNSLTLKLLKNLGIEAAQAI